MDVLAVTDFPDIRCKSLIQSASDGSVIIIPREGGYLFRVYVEMDKLAAGERVADRNITVEDVIAAARRVLALCARREGSALVVGLRDRPAPVRQVRRRRRGGRRTPALRVHCRRCLPHPQPESGAGHERLHAGRLQSRLEADVRAAQACQPAPAAQLFGGTPGHRQGADRFRSRVGDGAQLVRAGGRPGRDATLFRPARPLHRRHCDALSAVAAHRRRHPSASRRGADDRHAVSFGAGYPRRRRQAHAARPYDQG